MVETKFKQTDVGLIPEDWEVAEFGDVLRFLPTNTLPRELLCDKGTFKNIHYGDVLIKYGSVLDVSNTPIPCIDSIRRSSYHPKCLAQDGDIIIADTAEDETVCKATELWNIGSLKIVSGMHTMWCRPQKRIFAVKYLGYFINSGVFHNQILPLIQGIKVSSVSKRDIQGTWLIVPTMEEQERIASALTSIDNLISSLDKQIAKTRNIKQGVMRQLLTFPDNVEFVKFCDICSFIKGVTYSKSEEQGIDADGYRILRANNITLETNTLNFDDVKVIKKTAIVKQEQLLRANDILMCVGSGSKEHIGKVAHINESLKYYFGGFMGVIRVKKGIDSKYLFYILTGKIFKDYLEQAVSCCTINNINSTIINDFTIPVPSIEEQQRIASTLTAMDNQIAALEAKRRKYEMLKQGMMQQLLTGKIRLSR